MFCRFLYPCLQNRIAVRYRTTGLNVQKARLSGGSNVSSSDEGVPKNKTLFYTAIITSILGLASVFQIKYYMDNNRFWPMPASQDPVDSSKDELGKLQLSAARCEGSYERMRLERDSFRRKFDSSFANLMDVDLDVGGIDFSLVEVLLEEFSKYSIEEKVFLRELDSLSEQLELLKQTPHLFQNFDERMHDTSERLKTLREYIPDIMIPPEFEASLFKLRKLRVGSPEQVDSSADVYKLDQQKVCDTKLNDFASVKSEESTLSDKTPTDEILKDGSFKEKDSINDTSEVLTGRDVAEEIKRSVLQTEQEVLPEKSNTSSQDQEVPIGLDDSSASQEKSLESVGAVLAEDHSYPISSEVKKVVMQAFSEEKSNEYENKLEMLLSLVILFKINEKYHSDILELTGKLGESFMNSTLKILKQKEAEFKHAYNVKLQAEVDNFMLETLHDMQDVSFEVNKLENTIANISDKFDFYKRYFKLSKSIHELSREVYRIKGDKKPLVDIFNEVITSGGFYNAQDQDMLVSMGEMFPQKSLEEGVCSELDLIERFETIKKSARLTSFMFNKDMNFWNFVISGFYSYAYMYSKYGTRDIESITEENFTSSDNLLLLKWAEEAMKERNLNDAVKTISKLQGYSRRLFEDWLQQANLLLQCRLLCDVLTSLASNREVSWNDE